jgi:thioredoxin 1
MATKTITDDSFSADVLESQGVILVDYWAEWCGPCKQIAPALDEISEEMADTVTVAKLNIDENPNTAGSYGVRGIPTMMLFKDGEIAATKVGAMPKNKIVEWINESI